VSRDRVARRRAVVYALLVALCVGLIAASETDPLQDVRRGVSFALAPIQATLARATRSVTDVVGALGEVDRMRQANAELSRLVEHLEDQLAQLEAVEIENERLAALLGTRAALARETLVAEVVIRQSTPFERLVTLDRGERAGVELGFAVLSEGGALVGTVVEVGPEHATVRLISDTRSLVIGIDSETRATGEVTGRLSASLAMVNIPATDEVEVGNLIVTAGLSLGREFRSFYPRNLVIGRVVDVITDPGAIVQTALIEPAANLDHLEAVLVITDYRVPSRDPGPSPDPGEDDADEDPDLDPESEFLPDEAA
jgi:rod shape-determining protein MreC